MPLLKSRTKITGNISAAAKYRELLSICNCLILFALPEAAKAYTVPSYGFPSFSPKSGVYIEPGVSTSLPSLLQFNPATNSQIRGAFTALYSSSSYVVSGGQLTTYGDHRASVFGTVDPPLPSWNSLHVTTNVKKGVPIQIQGYINSQTIDYQVSQSFAVEIPTISFAQAISGDGSYKPLQPTYYKQFVTAAFVPGYNISLEYAAQLGGYDHFNWRNYVTGHPALSSLRLGTGARLPAVFSDQPKEGYVNWDGSHYDNGTGETTAYPFYYSNERLAEVSGYGSISFTDAPGNGCLIGGSVAGTAACDYNTSPAGSATYFSTDLVGVRADGTSGPALLNFKWKSDFNGTTDGGASVFSNDGIELFGTMGGVSLLSSSNYLTGDTTFYDVASVPLPHSVLTFGAALLALSLLGCCRLMRRDSRTGEG